MNETMTTTIMMRANYMWSLLLFEERVVCYSFLAKTKRRLVVVLSSFVLFIVYSFFFGDFSRLFFLLFFLRERGDFEFRVLYDTKKKKNLLLYVYPIWENSFYSKKTEREKE